MKIIILHQNIKDQIGMKAGIYTALEKLKGIGFSATVDFKEVTYPFTTNSFDSLTVGKGVAVKPEEILNLPEVKGYKLACLIFDASEVTPPATNPAQYPLTINGCTSIQIPVQWYSDLAKGETYQEVLVQYFLHELAHSLCYLSGKPDKVHSQFSFPEWQNKQPTDYYLFLINELKSVFPIFDAGTPVSTPIPPVVSTKYEFFSQKEVDTFKLKPELWQFLDKARKIANTPFVLSSGYRTPEQNKLAGGVANSSHLKGLGADIQCTDNIKRTKILTGIYNTGIPCFVEICRNHIHVDLDASIHSMGQTMWANDD